MGERVSIDQEVQHGQPPPSDPDDQNGGGASSSHKASSAAFQLLPLFSLPFQKLQGSSNTPDIRPYFSQKMDKFLKRKLTVEGTSSVGNRASDDLSKRQHVEINLDALPSDPERIS
ncbi:hypothetical protein SASPL_144448 [Salvia splendens]|uniref:Uncharacterized protein n=1 Tax=Salvia splendens TaxID=180675 RepID=A0A8X8WGE0_SALSN|nr:hypothetical protein SASPL_144448 [Salvia splendens]